MSKWYRRRGPWRFLIVVVFLLWFFLAGCTTTRPAKLQTIPYDYTNLTAAQNWEIREYNLAVIHYNVYGRKTDWEKFADSDLGQGVAIGMQVAGTMLHQQDLATRVGDKGQPLPPVFIIKGES